MYFLPKTARMSRRRLSQSTSEELGMVSTDSGGNMQLRVIQARECAWCAVNGSSLMRLVRNMQAQDMTWRLGRVVPLVAVSKNDRVPSSRSARFAPPVFFELDSSCLLIDVVVALGVDMGRVVNVEACGVLRFVLGRHEVDFERFDDSLGICHAQMSPSLSARRAITIDTLGRCPSRRPRSLRFVPVDVVVRPTTGAQAKERTPLFYRPMQI